MTSEASYPGSCFAQQLFCRSARQRDNQLRVPRQRVTAPHAATSCFIAALVTSVFFAMIICKQLKRNRCGASRGCPSVANMRVGDLADLPRKCALLKLAGSTATKARGCAETAQRGGRIGHMQAAAGEIRSRYEICCTVGVIFTIQCRFERIMFTVRPTGVKRRSLGPATSCPIISSMAAASASWRSSIIARGSAAWRSWPPLPARFAPENDVVRRWVVVGHKL
jgi:hypothetical protein